MFGEYRNGVMIDGTALQQSMTSMREHYGHERVNYPVLGIVLSVSPADSAGNRSAWERTDRRGFSHEAEVFVVNDSEGGGIVLQGVRILPPGPTGVDNYSEYLPRPALAHMQGLEPNLQLHGIDPYDLDGDWCVVGFVGGYINQAFMMGWWPHPRNTPDAATSGAGNPDANGNGTALLQTGRYFQRINGVEYVVTKKGNIYLSTNLTSSRLLPTDPVVEGRIARDTSEEGGSIALDIKPGQIIEINFNPRVDGVGLYGVYEDELPQTNPRTVDQPPQREATATVVHFDDAAATIEVPEQIVLESQDVASLTGVNSVTIEGTTIYLGENAQEPAVLGQALYDWITTARVLTAMGPAYISPEDIATFPDVFSQKVKVE